MTAVEKTSLCYVVDDEPSTRDIVTSVLNGTNVQSEHFDSVAKMLEYSVYAQPDLIIIDVTVSSSTARSYMDLLLAANVKCPIRLMSGLNGLLTEAVRHSWEKGGLKVLPTLAKPLRQQTIKQAVHTLVSARRATPAISIADVIDNGWFELWYQPRVDLNSKVLAGAEAFFRARHPQLGIIPAGDLLEGASEAELLNLTTRVIGRALIDWKAFRTIGLPIKLSVNVPVCALKRLSLFSVFWEYGPDTPDWPGLTLELKEDEIIPHMALAFSAVKELQMQKIGLAIDSFGLGFEELSRHAELPFSEIKIDRSFICNCDTDRHNATLCETIVDFAHRYRIKVVAEGIETRGELNTLRAMGCDYGQGYLLAQPMNKTDFVSRLQERSNKVAAKQSA
jgi:EAL domain-containing protein (putative c-di-GMP-specific phosphodiesterase class I)